MPVNLHKDFAKITRHLKQRVREYPVYLNQGPGNDEDPISLITLGFDYDQSGGVAFVFDTRPKASPDGKWNSYIEENLFECNHWTRWPGKLILVDGSSIKLDGDADPDIVANCFGDMLQQVF